MDLSSSSGGNDVEMNSRTISDRRDSSISSSNFSSGDLNNSCGSMSVEKRREKLKKYWEKKKRRKSQKFVRYECRKNLAENRFRY